jgi:hypothetical protein
MLAISTSLLGCARAEWQQIEIDSPYRAPQVLTVDVSAAPGQQEAARALASSLANALRHGGITTVIVPPASGAAEANVTITRWGSASSAKHELEGDPNAGQITVTLDTATIGIAGTAHGWATGGFFGSNANSAASEVGSLIGWTIVTGRGDALYSHSLPRPGARH